MKVKKMGFAGLILVLFLALYFSACKRPDNDGMPDEWEKQYGLNPNDPADAGLDLDQDGLTNLQEYKEGTDPNKEDTDNDGLKDAFELQKGTSPTNPDTDADSDPDGLDCEPLNPSINHKAAEGPINTPTCADTFDNDCDGAIDSVDSNCTCKADADCTIQLPCNQTICDQGTCWPKPLPDKTACDDKNCCTDQDQCQAGACIGAPKKCPAKKVCDPASCACQAQP